MFNLHASDILQHWSVTHALAVQQTSDRTLRDMKRLPSHLVEDVNARGLPDDVVTNSLVIKSEIAFRPKMRLL